MATWYILQIADRETQETREYGPWRSKEKSNRLADRFNAAVERLGEYDQAAHAFAVPIHMPTLRELKDEWLKDA